MSKFMLECPDCDSNLQLSIGYSGADWDTVAGEGSGYGHVLSLVCTNNKCACVFPLVHLKESYHASVVKTEYRNFMNYNL